MGIITRHLAEFTQTPEYQRGFQAYDIAFRVPSGDKYMGLLVDGSANISAQIRQGVYERQPEAVDYTFRKFDYLAWQQRAAVQKLVQAAWGYAGFRVGASYEDEIGLNI